MSFYSNVCVYHVVVNKKTSRSGISSSDEFLVKQLEGNNKLMSNDAAFGFC